MTNATENKKLNWEDEAKLRSQVHMAVRLCINTDNLIEALRVLKQEHVDAKRARKKIVVETKQIA